MKSFFPVTLAFRISACKGLSIKEWLYIHQLTRNNDVIPVDVDFLKILITWAVKFREEIDIIETIIYEPNTLVLGMDSDSWGFLNLWDLKAS